MSRARFLVSRALFSKYLKMSRPKKPCHGHILGFLSRALILMSRPLFLVQNCHGLFFDVTAIFSKNVTGTVSKIVSIVTATFSVSRAQFWIFVTATQKSVTGTFFGRKLSRPLFFSRAVFRKLSRALKKMSRGKK